MGATVLKIEGPASDGQDDGTRQMFLTRADREAGRPSLAFRALKRGQEAARDRPAQRGGRTQLLELARGADLLVGAFAPA